MSSIITKIKETIGNKERKKPYLIGISGGSGGGKTSVANLIFKSIGAEYALLFSMDTYYKDLTPEQEKNLSNYNFDSPEALDLDLLYQHLNDLMHWKNIKMPTYDFSKNKRNSYTIDLKPAKIIVFEGILAFYDKRMRELMDLKLFIDLDDDIRLSRRIFRDIISRGRNMETVLDRYHKFVKPAYNNFIKPTKEYADIIIPRGGSNTVAIDLINYHLKYLIENVTFINDKGEEVGGVNDDVREESKKHPSITVTFYNDIKTIEAIKKEEVFCRKYDICLVSEKEEDMFLDMYKNYLKGEKKEYYDLYMDIYTQKIKEEIDNSRKEKEEYVKDDLIIFSNDSKEKINKIINEKIQKLKTDEYLDIYYFIPIFFEKAQNKYSDIFKSFKNIEQISTIKIISIFGEEDRYRYFNDYRVQFKFIYSGEGTKPYAKYFENYGFFSNNNDGNSNNSISFSEDNIERRLLELFEADKPKDSLKIINNIQDEE